MIFRIFSKSNPTLGYDNTFDLILGIPLKGLWWALSIKIWVTLWRRRAKIMLLIRISFFTFSLHLKQSVAISQSFFTHSLLVRCWKIWLVHKTRTITTEFMFRSWICVRLLRINALVSIINFISLVLLRKYAFEIFGSGIRLDQIQCNRFLILIPLLKFPSRHLVWAVSACRFSSLYSSSTASTMQFNFLSILLRSLKLGILFYCRWCSLLFVNIFLFYYQNFLWTLTFVSLLCRYFSLELI